MTVIDLNGCEASLNAFIIVSESIDIYAPNAFSPNNDGINDHFTLYSNDIVTIDELNIYDRWGAKMFTTKDIPASEPRLGWNGEFKGELLNPAVFVYTAIVTLENGKQLELKGDINLVD